MSNIFDQIKFNPNYHTYYLNGQKMQNVTKVIKQFQKPFDKYSVANRVAQKQNRSIDEIIAEWEAKGEASRQLGTRVHSHIENVLRNRPSEDDPFLGLNQTQLLPEEKAFNELWGYMSDEEVADPIDVYQVEWVVGDKNLNVAGTIDSVLYLPDNKTYHIWDWKTGKFDTSNPYRKKLLGAFDDLDDCKLNYYSLQLSLYRLILERNTKLQMGDSYLVHLSEQGYQIHKAVDLRERLEMALLTPDLLN